MKFCKECGHELNREATFCTDCGTPVSKPSSQGGAAPNQSASNVTGKPIENPLKKMTKKQKLITSIVAGIIVIFFIMFQVGSSLTSKETAIEKLETAIVNKDKKELANLIVSSDSRLKIDEKNVEGFLKYINDNPKYMSDLLEDLKKQAILIDSKKQDENSIKANGELFEEEYYESNQLLSLKQTGKSALVFDRYRFEIKPFFINVRTNYKGAKIYLNDKKIATTDSNDYVKEFGPYIPGTYSLKAEYAGDYAKMTSEKEINLFDYNGYADVELWLEAMYVSAESNFSDSKVYINGKDSGITVEEFDEFGPVSPGVKVQAVRSFPWGEIKSEEVGLESGKSYYELDLVPENNDYKATLKDMLKEYQKSKSESIIVLDANKLVHASADYKESLSEQISEWKEAGYKYHGGLIDITIDMDYGEVRYDDENQTYTTTVRYISNFKGDWTYGNETSEEITEAKKNESKVYNYVDLVYDNTAKQWVVEHHSEESWSFEIEDGEKIIF
jgi:uncharacterized membrane protein YvbJ